MSSLPRLQQRLVPSLCSVWTAQMHTAWSCKCVVCGSSTLSSTLGLSPGWLLWPGCLLHSESEPVPSLRSSHTAGLPLVIVVHTLLRPVRCRQSLFPKPQSCIHSQILCCNTLQALRPSGGRLPGSRRASHSLRRVGETHARQSATPAGRLDTWPGGELPEPQAALACQACKCRPRETR